METNNDIVRFDWAAKRLLRQKANFDVLEGFLSVLLNEQIKIEEILESESNQRYEDDKFNRVDIKARNSKNEIIIIEIQNTRQVYYLERIIYGVSKAVTEHAVRGKGYDQVKKVYSISILYFDIGKGTDYLYHGTTKFKGVNTGDELMVTLKEKNGMLPLNPSTIFPEYFLIRVNEFDKVAVTPLEEWIAYLKTGTIVETTHAPGLEEAREKLLYYKMSKEDQDSYNQHLDNLSIQKNVLETAYKDGKAEGKAEGMEEGKAEGIMEGKMDVARKMRADNLPIDVIVKYSGLSEEEIQQL